jgi:hypothetical protein
MRHWETLDVIEREPYKVSGAWVFRKTRVPVSALFENLRDTDRNLRYQQNLSDRQIAIIVLISTSWPKIRMQTDKVCDVINSIKLGDYAEIPM